MVDIEKIEAVIESAMKTAVRLGWTIVPGRLADGTCDPRGVDTSCGCPLEAVAFVNGVTPSAASGGRVLGFEFNDDQAFWMGFDDYDWQQVLGSSPNPELTALGERFASRVKSGEFSRAVVCPEMP